VILVTGLSGAGKASVLRTLEDLGYEAVDNPPLPMLDEMVARSDHKLAIGVDARSRGFDASLIVDTIMRLRAKPDLYPELVYMWAEDTTLLRRYTESRRRHPLAADGPVAEAIAAEQALTAELRQVADLVVDTSDMQVSALRRLIERHFGAGDAADARHLVVSLMSFAFPQGLPREADLVFDARFLRNPHYDPMLGHLTGLDPAVGAFVESDPDCAAYFSRITDLVDLVLPRFVQEGKQYATITIGCTGGRHRSVYLIEKLASHLTGLLATSRVAGKAVLPLRLHVSHRELARETQSATDDTDRSVPRRDGRANGAGSRPAPVQAQEA
jgi:UPF0042 nucleotide-binding protein